MVAIDGGFPACIAGEESAQDILREDEYGGKRFDSSVMLNSKAVSSSHAFTQS